MSFSFYKGNDDPLGAKEDAMRNHIAQVIAAQALGISPEQYAARSGGPPMQQIDEVSSDPDAPGGFFGAAPAGELGGTQVANGPVAGLYNGPGFTAPGPPTGYFSDMSANNPSAAPAPGLAPAGFVANAVNQGWGALLGEVGRGWSSVMDAVAQTPGTPTGRGPGPTGAPAPDVSVANPGYDQGFNSPGYDAAGIGMGFGGATGDGTSGSTAASAASGIGTSGNSTGISGGPGGTGEGGANTGEGGGGGGGGGGSK